MLAISFFTSIGTVSKICFPAIEFIHEKESEETDGETVPDRFSKNNEISESFKSFGHFHDLLASRFLQTSNQIPIIFVGLHCTRSRSRSIGRPSKAKLVPAKGPEENSPELGGG